MIKMSCKICKNCHCTLCNKHVCDFNCEQRSENTLKCWEKWMLKRQNIHQKLGKALDRKPGNLLMNFGDGRRTIIEEKCMLEYANITTTFDKYRGNPVFWTLPPASRGKKVKADDCGNLPANHPYFFVQTKIQKNEIPEIDFVGEPDLIVKEKDIIPKTRYIYHLWRDRDYRQKKLAQIASKLELLQPHIPDYRDLIITGKKIDVQQEIAEEPKDYASDEIEDNLYQLSATTNVETDTKTESIDFTINGIRLSDKNKKEMSAGFRKIRIVFERSIKSKTFAKLPVVFENKGLSTMRFHFNIKDKYNYFEHVREPRLQYVSPFYFKKNELILLPKETVTLSVYFKSNFPGKYDEMWEITTVPKFWYDEFHLILQLQGVSFTTSFEEKSLSIKENLANHVKNFLINDILRETLKLTNFENVSVPPAIFTEVELFESANEDTKFLQTFPKYIYDKNIVQQLKEFYELVREPNHPTKWNYSIEELTKMAREKDIIVYAEEKLKEKIAAHKRTVELQEICQIDEDKLRNRAIRGKSEKKQVKAVTEKGDKGLLKKTTVRGSVQAKKDKAKTEIKESIIEMKETYYSQLQGLLEKLEQPAVVYNLDRVKHLNAFFIARATITKMCEALDELDKQMNIDYLKHYPKKIITDNHTPARMVYQENLETCIPRVKLVTPEGRSLCLFTPKPTILKDIPQDDTVAVYKTFFKKPLPPKYKEKGDYADQKSKKKLSAPVKQPKTKEKIDEKSAQPLEKFEPFLEEFIPPTFSDDEDEPNAEILEETDEQATESESEISLSLPEEYKYLTYLIVYTHVEELADHLVDMLETCKEEQVSTKLIKRLIKCRADDKSCVFDDVEEESIESESISESRIESSNLVSEELSIKSVSESAKLQQQEYFDALLRLHWKENENTLNYVVDRKLKKRKEQSRVSVHKEEIQRFDPVDYSRKTDKKAQHFVERDAQTDEVRLEDFPILSSFIFRASETKPPPTVSSDVVEKENYYYLENDEVTGDTISTASGIGEVENTEQ